MTSVTIRMGAAHNSVSFNGHTMDMDTDFGSSPKESRRRARLDIVDAFTEAYGSRKDKRRLRRIRKGHAA